MPTNQIVKLGLETRANELRSSINPEYSVRDIARILTDESGQKITPNSVQRYFKAFKKTVSDLPAAGGPEKRQQDPTAVRELQQTSVRTAAVQERLDAIQQLRDMNEGVRVITEKFEEMLKEKGLSRNDIIAITYPLLAAYQRIEGQLTLQAKLLGDLPTQPTVNITLVQGQFNEFKTAVLGVMCPECQRRLVEQLRARVEQ